MPLSGTRAITKTTIVVRIRGVRPGKVNKVNLTQPTLFPVCCKNPVNFKLDIKLKM